MDMGIGVYEKTNEECKKMKNINFSCSYMIHSKMKENDQVLYFYKNLKCICEVALI